MSYNTGVEELILIKLGGSVITDKTKEFTARQSVIKRLAEEIKRSRLRSKAKFIIGHGGGSFPHTPALKYQTKKGLINKKSLMGMAITEDAARRLNSIVVKNFISVGLPVYPFSPGSFLISDTEIYSKSYIDPIMNALNINAVPLVYGDVVMDKEIGFTIFSTEKILSLLAKKLQKTYKIRMIYVTNVDGVYSEAETHDEYKKVIPVISGKNFNQLKKSILGAKGTDVTGGMIHKVEESIRLSQETGIETVIVNGLKAGILGKAILGRKVLSTKVVK